MFEIPSMGEHLIFKGGTSLSKVFRLIARFSEDIDLSIRRDYLEAVGKNDPEQEGISGTRRGRRVEALRERCRLAVRGEMLPALQTSFAAHLGAGAPAWRLALDPGEEGTLLFTYPPSEPSLPPVSGEPSTAIPAYIRPQVKQEMGTGSDPFPESPVALKRRAVIRGIPPRVRAVRVPLLDAALRVVDKLVDDAALLACPPAVGGHGVQRGERGGGAVECFLGNRS